MKRRMIHMAAALMFAGACQTAAAPKTPAVLADADNETLAQVKSVLSQAVGRANVELGPGDLTQNSTISVLPPPLGAREDRSMATPTLFDIILSDGACQAVRRDTGEAYALGVACRAAQ